MLLSELLAHALPCRVHELTIDQRVGSGEVDVLERACSPLACTPVLLGVNAVGADRQQLAGRDFPNELGTDRVKRAALGGHGPTIGQAPEYERADAPGITRRVRAL